MSYKIVETASDGSPDYVFNKNLVYENTVLQEHANLVSGLRDMTTTSAALEAQAPLWLGLALGADADEFIKSRFDKYYKEEAKALEKSNLVDTKLHDTAVNRVWLRLVNETVSIFSKQNRLRSRAKIAVIDTMTTDGHPVIDADLVEPEEPGFDDGEDAP